MEYEKQRNEKLDKIEKNEAETLKKGMGDGMGSEVKLNPYVTEVNTGREMTDIYLKHPGNESSEDEEGEVEVGKSDEVVEEHNFQNFLTKHKIKQNDKVEKMKE